MPVVFQFDLWTDSQRKRFFATVFHQCKRTQYKFIQNWFQDNVPLQHLDFTTVLPKFLSLYIFSFLDPKSLCRCAQVSWHWKFLSEQVIFHLKGNLFSQLNFSNFPIIYWYLASFSMYQYWIFFLWFKHFVCRWLEILMNWMAEELFLKNIAHWWKPCTTLIKQVVYKACLWGLFHNNQCLYRTGCGMDA